MILIRECYCLIMHVDILQAEGNNDLRDHFCQWILIGISNSLVRVQDSYAVESFSASIRHLAPEISLFVKLNGDEPQSRGTLCSL